MQLFLPIADIPVNVFLILAMGAAVGFVSGMFGIGGGFLMTPLLIFVGISPAVAVASVSSHMAASSFSGALSYWRKRAIDPALSMILLCGGVTGTALGVWIFALLRSVGQLDLIIALSYVVLLTAVGTLMFLEGLRAILRARRGNTVITRRARAQGWILGLPLKMRFKRSKIYLSVIPVIAVGLLVGFLGAIMGIGGSFLLIPIMIYVLRVPTATVIGTSMALTLVTMVMATVLHAVTNHLKPRNPPRRRSTSRRLPAWKRLPPHPHRCVRLQPRAVRSIPACRRIIRWSRAPACSHRAADPVRPSALLRRKSF